MTLIKLALMNLLGINVYINTKDPKKKRQKRTMVIVISLLILVVCLQMAAQSWWLFQIGAGHIIPKLMGLTAPMLIFLFALFDRSLFSRCGYEQLCSLPVKKHWIALSRLMRMYVLYFLLGLPVSLSFGAVYACAVHPEAAFYLRWGAGILLQPMLPISVSLWINGGIFAVSARCTHRTGMETVLQTAAAGAVLLLPAAIMGFPSLPGSGKEMKAFLEMLGDTIPMWVGDRFEDSRSFLKFLVLSVGSMGVTLGLTGGYGSFMTRLGGSRKIRRQSGSPAAGTTVLRTLYRKERKLYFSSSVYASNTIIGPILAAAAAAVLLFADTERLNLPFDIQTALPFGWCMVCVLMCPASVSLSMEGERVWILKTLPVSMGDVVRAKLMWSLTLLAPSYVLSGILLELGGMGGLWFWVLTPGMLLFAPLFGLAVNLAFQNYSWEKPEEVVKQGISSALGGMLPSLLCLILGIGCTLLPSLRPVISAVYLAADWLLYTRCCRGKWKNG